jgi:hypothetical protein
MNILHLTTVVFAGILMASGGHNFLFARREMMPIFIMSDCLYVTHNPWALTMLLACGILHLGYGDKSKFRHIFGDAWGRGVWGLLVALALSLWAVLTGHLALPWFIAYLIVGFFLEPLFKNLPQIFGDLIIGAGLASFVFFIH